MNIRAPRIAIPALFLFVLSRPALPVAADSGTASVRAVIEDEEARFARAEVRRDAEAMSEMYLDASAGRESAGRRLERVAAAGGTLVDERFEISNLEVCDDIAVESGQTVSQLDFPGRSRSVERMRYLSVWKRGPDGGWKVARDLWIEAGAPVPAPAAVSVAAAPVPPPPTDAVPIPDARSLGDGFVRTIQDDLRSATNRLRSPNPDPEKRRKAVAKADHDLRGWIRDIGWIDVVRFGVPAACDAAFIVSQSGDLALMQATVPLIQKDLANAEGGETCALESLKAYEALRNR